MSQGRRRRICPETTRYAQQPITSRRQPASSFQHKATVGNSDQHIALRAHVHRSPGLHSGRGAPGIHAGPFRPSSRLARASIFYRGPGGSRTTGAGDSPGEIVSARAPLALVLAKGEDSTAAGLRPGDVGVGLSPPDATRPGRRGSPASLTRATRRPSLIACPMHWSPTARQRVLSDLNVELASTLSRISTTERSVPRFQQSATRRHASRRCVEGFGLTDGRSAVCAGGRLRGS